jgi:hypothetical protein
MPELSSAGSSFTGSPRCARIGRIITFLELGLDIRLQSYESTRSVGEMQGRFGTPEKPDLIFQDMERREH